MQIQILVYTFALEIWDDEAEKVTFYTVKQEGSVENETDLFFSKYEIECEEAAQQLLHFILTSIGDEYGAIDDLFNRYENEVVGLPVQGKTTIGELTFHYLNFPLRLYALKITENIVILFNGGIKDGTTIQNSNKNLHFIWKDACRYATAITKAINNGTITVNEQERKLYLFDGSEVILL